MGKKILLLLAFFTQQIYSVQQSAESHELIHTISTIHNQHISTVICCSGCNERICVQCCSELNSNKPLACLVCNKEIKVYSRNTICSQDAFFAAATYAVIAGFVYIYCWGFPCL